MSAPEYIRTPEERFVDLHGFDFAPNYLDGPLRMHYLDEGPRDAGHVFLCLHGEPTWSYLYRKMIPVFVGAGHRVVAPDFFGFGRSDKPREESVYTIDFHRRSVVELIERLDLRGITLVGQDWGGIIGLTLPMDMPDRFARMLLMNTALPVGNHEPSPGFVAWKQYVRSKPDLSVGKLMLRSVDGLTEAEAAAYDAPFPDAEAKAGVRTFPELVPVTKDMPGAELNARASAWLSTRWAGTTFMAVGMQDPVLGPDVMAQLRETIRGCPAPLEVPEAGHFVQEHGESVARAALETFG